MHISISMVTSHNPQLPNPLHLNASTLQLLNADNCTQQLIMITSSTACHLPESTDTSCQMKGVSGFYTIYVGGPTLASPLGQHGS